MRLLDTGTCQDNLRWVLLMLAMYWLSSRRKKPWLRPWPGSAATSKDTHTDWLDGMPSSTQRKTLPTNLCGSNSQSSLWFSFNQNSWRLSLNLLASSWIWTTLQEISWGLQICVLMDISKTLPENIWISAPSMKGFWQQIRYPDPPLYCNHCGLQSHSIQTCWHKNP